MAAPIVDSSHYDAFARLLAAENPDTVFTHWPIDRHRDHRAVSLLTLDAWWKAGKNFALYYYEVAEDTTMFSPAEYVDISVRRIAPPRRLLRARLAAARKVVPETGRDYPRPRRCRWLPAGRSLPPPPRKQASRIALAVLWRRTPIGVNLRVRGPILRAFWCKASTPSKFMGLVADAFQLPG